MSAPLLKDLYSPAFYQQFTNILSRIIPGLDEAAFHQQIFTKDWPQKELKDRMRHTTAVLHHVLPKDFPKATGKIIEVVEILEQEMTDYRLEFMFLPDYIERFGLEHYEAAVQTMERITQFTSCEFAVRPFIIKYEAQMMAQMLKWAEHPHEEVRRLASEGCRPRLPWAMALPRFKKDPALVLPVLERLKADASLYVRRSVANNLNDISKDHPDLVLDISTQWQGIGKNTDWLIKHACRTLLKAGHPEAMLLFGYAAPDDIHISDFQLSSREVSKGGKLEFTFQVKNQGQQTAKVRLEYGMYFLRANGNHSKKVFMIGERQLESHQPIAIQQSFSFKPITTRTYYAGQQEVSIIVNGVEKGKMSFVLS
jgi:3-methyladenine DNA glycosylase AlkC